MFQGPTLHHVVSFDKKLLFTSSLTSRVFKWLPATEIYKNEKKKKKKKKKKRKKARAKYAKLFSKASPLQLQKLLGALIDLLVLLILFKALRLF